MTYYGTGDADINFLKINTSITDYLNNHNYSKITILSGIPYVRNL